MIRAAIVGLGWWGKTLVNAVAGKEDQLSFVLAHTRSHDKVADFCRDKNLKWVDTLDAVLASDVDAVVFCNAS